jgi:hypothetical protein
MHQQIARALDRAARTQEYSRTLIEEYRRARVALEETIVDAHRRRNARAGNGSER